MSALHVIRLRGPWEYVVLARFVPRGAASDGAFDESREELPPPGRVTMPTNWGATLGPDFRGRVEYRRRFGCPTGITPAERVWLVCDSAEATVTFSLNGETLGSTQETDSSAEFDVSDRLRERNELLAVVESSSTPGGLTGEVRLEIRSTG
jgi:beta-galactosidase/beta-glucuronidase